MQNSSITVTFSITFDHKLFISEKEIGGNDSLISKIQQTENLEGSISIVYEDKSILIVDELVPWIQNLCFVPIPNLVCGENAEINYFSREGVLHIENDGKMVTMSDRFNKSASYPLKEIILALMDCGNRFINTMRPIKQGDAVFIAELDRIFFFKQLADDSIAYL